MTGGPRLSVVIPTYNRSAVLDLCLRALSRQTLPPGAFEVIVGDDGSVDSTPKLVEQWSGRMRSCGGPAVEYTAAPNAGANAARNRAIMLAAAPIVLLINDDTIPVPEMAAQHLEGHADHPEENVAVLGRVTVSPESPRNRLAELHLDRAYAAIGDRRKLDWRSFFTCNISVKRSLLLKAGLFEEKMRYHEDLEFAERLSRFGLCVIYRPEALGYHHHHLTEAEFLGIARREARALVVWSRKAPHLAPVLAEFGFEPALKRSVRLKNRVRGIAFNPKTNPLWSVTARRCPPWFDKLALKLYLQIYQSEKRTWLLRELYESEDRVA